MSEICAVNVAISKRLGKTHKMCIAALEELSRPTVRFVAILGPSRRQIKTNLIPQFHRILEQSRIKHEIRHRDRIIIGKKAILFYSARSPEFIQVYDEERGQLKGLDCPTFADHVVYEQGLLTRPENDTEGQVGG